MAAKTIKGPKKSGVCDLRWISIGVCVCLFVFFPPRQLLVNGSHAVVAVGPSVLAARSVYGVGFPRVMEKATPRLSHHMKRSHLRSCYVDN